MTIGDRAIEAVERHPAVRCVRLVGSRVTGTATAFSDWDLAVETDDFPSVARDIGTLLAPLRPLAQQWDPLSDTWCWMAMVPGPVKIDCIFTEPHRHEPPWRPSPDNLVAIDHHFWDWALWLDSKQARGSDELVRGELDKLFVHVLRPLGAETRPDTLDDAVDAYLAGRERAQRRCGVTIPRALEREVVRVLQ